MGCASSSDKLNMKTDSLSRRTSNNITITSQHHLTVCICNKSENHLDLDVHLAALTLRLPHLTSPSPHLKSTHLRRQKWPLSQTSWPLQVLCSPVNPHRSDRPLVPKTLSISLVPTAVRNPRPNSKTWTTTGIPFDLPLNNG